MSAHSIPAAKFGPASQIFGRILTRLRAVDHFAVGRRVLALVALAHLGPMFGLVLRGLSDAQNDPVILQALKRAMGEVAKEVDASHPFFEHLFEETLVPDVLQSQWEQTATYASAIVTALPPACDRDEYGIWFSSCLDEIITAGPVATEVGTPPALASFMIFLAQIERGQTVYDPCCGLGGLLKEAWREAKPTLVGAEIHRVSASLARLRLYFLGAKAIVHRRDALSAPETRYYDRIVCDPPLGPYLPAGHDFMADRSRTGHGTVRRMDSLFLEHAFEQLSDKGRAVVLVSQGALSRRGADQIFRDHLIKERVLEAVISLPSSTLSWTNVEVALVVISNETKLRSAKIIDGNARLIRNARAQDVFDLLRDMYLKFSDFSVSRMIDYASLLEAGTLLPRRLLATPVERPDPDELRQKAERLLNRAGRRLPHIRSLFDQISTFDE